MNFGMFKSMVPGLALVGLAFALSGCGCTKQGGDEPSAQDETQKVVAERMADPTYVAKLDHQNEEMTKARHAVAVAIAAYDKAKNDGADEATLKALEAALKKARADFHTLQEATKLIIRDKMLEQKAAKQ